MSLKIVKTVGTYLTRIAVCTLADMRKLDPDDPRPPYRQIADELSRAIGTGELQPGDQIPGLVELTEQYGVSQGTARSAVSTLREAGMVVTRHGKGTFVRIAQPGRAAASEDALAEVRDVLADLSARLAAVERRLDAL